MHLSIAVPLWLFTCVFLQPGSAEDILCTVTQDDRGTLYSVLEFEADNCFYGWENTNRSVLANHMGKKEEIVVTKSNRILLTNKCLERIYYTRDCISEGIQHTATCTSNCTGNGGFLDDAVTGFPIYLTVVIVVVVGFLVLLVLFFALQQKTVQRSNVQLLPC